MKSMAAVMSEMKEAGAPFEAVMIAVRAIEDAMSETDKLRLEMVEKREKRAEQKRHERDVSREVAATVERLSRDSRSDNDATVVATVASQPASPPPPKRYNQTPTTPPTHSVEAQAREWFSESFWPGWPEKVGKLAAEKAGIKLFRARRGDMAEVIEGRDRYIAIKPTDRPWLNPATFLNQERFNDRPTVPPARAGPQRRSGGDGIDEARRMLRERHGQRDHDTEGESGAGDTDASDVHPRQDIREQDRDGTVRPYLDLVARSSFGR